MLTLMEDLGRKAAEGLRATFGADAGIPEVLPITRSQRPDLGDLQCSAAMQLAKPLRKPPREIAQALAGHLQHPAVAEIKVEGPGFINLRLTDAWLAAEAGRGIALRDLGHGRRVVIDFSSPNVAKPMHIAHIRSTIIGDAIRRAMRAVGYEVVADNHLGDWGTQFGKLIVAYRRWLDRAAYEASPVDELLRLYIKFVDEEKAQRKAPPAGPAPDAEPAEEEEATEVTPLLEEARAELVKLQRGDAENVALWRQFVDVSLREFERVYRRLGVTFDVTLGESFYNDRLANTVALLERAGLAEESRGAKVIFFKRPDGTDELPPFLVQKGDGGYNYATTDIAAIFYRVETWDPARILVVTDERQQLHFSQLFATARRLIDQGALKTDASFEHVWFGLMRLPEGTISTREGKLISLEALLDEAERRALDIARAKAAEKAAEKEGGGEAPLSEQELREVARVVGMGAVKYNDLSKDRQTLVTFTWDKALALQGNTAPYLQYAYARIRSILRKAAAEGAVAGPIPALSPVERELVKRLLGFPEAVEQVARTRPHVLCEYLFDLAGAFSTFYAEHPVLKAEPAVRAGRLQLCAQVAETIRRGLDLLGIEVAERM